MNIQVNTQSLRYTSRELYEISSDLARLAPELEDIRRELNKQTVFRTSIRSLDNAAEQLSKERYRVSVLAQALDNIVRLYRETEETVGNRFSDFILGCVVQPAVLVFNNVTNVRHRLSALLYGGDSQWQK